MDLKMLTFLLAFVISLVSSESIPQATTTSPSNHQHYLRSNSTLTTLSSSGPEPSSCCFIVQDVVQQHWWEVYSTGTPIFKVVNVTSITTFVELGPSTVRTRYETNVRTTNASFVFTYPVGYNPATLMLNNAPQPLQTTSKIVNSTQVVTAGVTVQSPAAFWVYSTVKIITVPAVTDAGGNAVCATPSQGNSTGFSPGAGLAKPTGPTSDIFAITSINSNAEAYFGGSSISGRVATTEGAITGATTRSAFTFTDTLGSLTTRSVSTQLLHETLPVWARSNGETFVFTPSTTGVAITFPTPFIYLPPRGATGGTEAGAISVCLQTGGNENYGYVPQSVIDHMISEPAIRSQYPGIASCLPAGPSIIHVPRCGEPAPAFQSAGGDLTEGTIITVGGGAIQTTPALPPAAPLTTETPAAIPVVPTPISPAPPVAPVVTGAPAPIETPIPAVPAAPLPETNPPNPPNPPPSPEDAQTSGAAVPTEETPTSVGGIIASVIGLPASPPNQNPAPAGQNAPPAITTPSSPSFIVIQPGTIAQNEALSLVGSTTIISNTPYIIVSSATTIRVQDGAAVTRLPYPDNGQDITTVVGGVTVVIPGANTTAGANTTTAAPGFAQAGDAGRGKGILEFFWGVVGATMWMVIA
ncbi:hypothetical protein B0O99DRAFT_689906 [Bisporella sp. PMI_857]|nr:hypothetical protein B0O99DRAFT_689906 [Bisporella sp. PMI_857]